MSAANRSAQSRFLQRLLQRSTLSEADRAAIVGLRGHASHGSARRPIVSPGEKVDHACLVVSGVAARFDQLRDGARQITAIYFPGDMCDLHSVPVPKADWGIESLTETRILYVRHEDLRALMQSPAIAMAFWRDTVADASILAKWVANIGRRDALARLSHLLCEIGVRSEQAEIGTRTAFALDITQDQLADALGLTPVHVNRTFRALREQGVLAIRDRTVQVESWDRLATLAEFDPGYLLYGPAQKREAA